MFSRTEQSFLYFLDFFDFRLFGHSKFVCGVRIVCRPTCGKLLEQNVEVGRQSESTL